MTDIHCHILPFVDDGSENIEDSLAMARLAAESGVSAIIATPHCNLPYHGPTNYKSAQLAQRFIQLQDAIVNAGIPLRIFPGAEILCTPEVPDLLRQGKLLTLAGSDYLLVEFFFDESLTYMDDMLSAVAAEGLIPVIAHPERYEAVQRNPHVVERWFRDGCIIQVNKGSILGRLGRRAELTSEWILSRGLAHAVASDAHSPLVRTPQMTEVFQHLSDYYAPEYEDILLNLNPARILDGLPVLSAD